MGKCCTALLLLLALGLPACAPVEGAWHYASGTRALDQRAPERAIEELEHAAKLLPESSEVLNHLGIAYEKAGRHDEARAAFRRATRLDCSNEAAQHNLAAAEAFEARRAPKPAR